MVVATTTPHPPRPHRLEASWDDSSFICEPKWWTRLCVKLPVWVKTGLRLLLIDCSFSWVHDGCQATFLKFSQMRCLAVVLLLDGDMRESRNLGLLVRSGRCIHNCAAAWITMVMTPSCSEQHGNGSRSELMLPASAPGGRRDRPRPP